MIKGRILIYQKSRLWGDPFVEIDTILIVAENVA